MIVELQGADTLERNHERMQSMVNDTQPVSLEHCYIVALCCLYHGHSLLERVYEMSDRARDFKYLKSSVAADLSQCDHFQIPCNNNQLDLKFNQLQERGLGISWGREPSSTGNFIGQHTRVLPQGRVVGELGR